MERLRKAGSELVYRCAKQYSEPSSDKRGAKADELTLSPLELIDRIAALVPPPRTHRHRYFGVLAANSPLRAAVTALAAAPAQPTTAHEQGSEPNIWCLRYPHAFVFWDGGYGNFSSDAWMLRNG